MYKNSDNQILIENTRAMGMCKSLIIKDLPPPPEIAEPQ